MLRMTGGIAKRPCKMNYSQAEEYLNSFVNYENIPGISYASSGYSLKHVEDFLHRIGDPQLAARTVHIAGTKGKGSVAAMIAQVLSTSGYRTGLYTSPHLHTLRERIRVDGSLISQSAFASLMTELKPYFDSVNAAVVGQSPKHREAEASQPLTFFEALTALAFAYFSKKKVDFQVLEVGLGGRLDATNVTKPEVCVITPISLDHTAVLGDSVDRIAGEKAGIIKPGSFVVSSPQVKQASQVISAVCRQQGASLVQVGKDITWHKVAGDFHQQSFVVQGKTGTHQLTIPLLGDYQLENAATAIATLEVLATSGSHISTEDIARGLAQVKWPGRFQIINHEPMVVIDGAHNVASMRRLVKNIKAYFNYDQIFLILGISCDKDIPGIVKQLVPLSPQVIVTRSSHPRAASPSVIAAEFAKWGIKPGATDSIAQGLSQALSTAKENDLVCVTGSLFAVAEALDYAAKCSNL